MWPFLRKLPHRRLEVRKSIAASTPNVWHRLLKAPALAMLPAAAILLAAVIAMDLTPLEPLRYRQGQYIPADIYPRVRFEVPSPRLLAERLAELERTVPAVFSLQENVLNEMVGRIRLLPEAIKSAAMMPSSQPSSTPATTPDAQTQPTQPAEATLQEQYDRLAGPLREAFDLKPADLPSWAEYAAAGQRADLFKRIDALREALVNTYFIRSGEIFIRRDAAEALMAGGGGFRREPIDELFDRGDARKVSESISHLAEPFEAAVRPNIEAYLRKFFSGAEGLYHVDMEASRRRLDLEKEALIANPPMEMKDLKDRLVARTGSRPGGTLRGAGTVGGGVEPPSGRACRICPADVSQPPCGLGADRRPGDDSAVCGGGLGRFMR